MGLNLIQISVPRSISGDEDIEKFNEDLKQEKAQYKQQDAVVIMVDFNTKIGDGREKN